jgi:hypothetical protein
VLAQSRSVAGGAKQKCHSHQTGISAAFRRAKNHALSDCRCVSMSDAGIMHEARTLQVRLAHPRRQRENRQGMCQYPEKIPHRKSSVTSE